MKTQCLNSDRISTLPENITEKILSHIPIQEALRTSVLSKKWRYSWQSMPKLVFTAPMVKAGANCDCRELKKYKVVNAILHVLLLHNCPAILEFNSSILQLDIFSEFAQIASYLARGNKVRELYFKNHSSLSLRKLPVSFFSLHGLELIQLHNCTFEPPLTVETFSRLKCLTFYNVNVSAQMLQRFLSKCPLLERIVLLGDKQSIDFAAGGSKFTFLDLLECVPLIQVLIVVDGNCLSAGGMPHKLPTPLGHLEYLRLSLILTDHNEMSSALCIIRSSPVLKELIIETIDDEKLPAIRKTPTNFLDPKDYSDLKLDHLKTLKITDFTDLPLEMDFVRLIMTKSPVLENVRIELFDAITLDEELKMLRDLVLHPLPRLSPSVKVVIERPKTSK